VRIAYYHKASRHQQQCAFFFFNFLFSHPLEPLFTFNLKLVTFFSSRLVSRMLGDCVFSWDFFKLRAFRKRTGVYYCETKITGKIKQVTKETVSKFSSLIWLRNNKKKLEQQTLDSMSIWCFIDVYRKKAHKCAPQKCA
jgi:hypothetical protein